MALTNKIDAIAEAIREKTGGTAALTLEEMPAEIRTIPSSAFEGEYIPGNSTYTLTQQFSAIGNAIREKTGGAAGLTLDDMPAAIRSINEIPRTPTSALNYNNQMVISLYNPNNDITDVVIPGTYGGSAVLGIADGAFRVPKSGNFIDCETRSVLSVYIEDGLQTIGEQAFYSLSSGRNLEQMRLPNTLTSIGEYAFYNCSKMRGLHIPDSVEYIGPHAFENCKALTNFNIPTSLKGVIPDYMLAGCQNIANDIIVPEGITAIGEYAFMGCYRLTKIVLPSTITTIGTNAFYGVGASGWCHIYVPWSKDEVPGAPWGATNATIHYNYGGEN